MKMISSIKELYFKYKQEILYLFFGAATTVINTVCYAVLYECLRVENVISTVIAWICAVIFAFVTNKYFVFDSKSNQKREILAEAVSFFGCRVATGVLDVVIMFVFVSCLEYNSILWKLISNIIVIILNYFASRFLIFQNKNK